MKKAISLLLVFLLSNCEKGNAQSAQGPVIKRTKEQNVLYEREALNFIRQVEGRTLNTTFILVDKPTLLTSSECIDYVLSDVKTYSEEELRFIKQNLDPAMSSWRKAALGVKLISKDTINFIFRDYTKRWEYFNKHIGREYNEFSTPIFLRNYTYCLFYFANYCGRLCGGGELVLYKKEKGNWVIAKSYCTWES